MSGIGNEEPVQIKLNLKKLYGSVMVSRMSGIDEITDRLTYVYKGLALSVCKSWMRSCMDKSTTKNCMKF